MQFSGMYHAYQTARDTHLNFDGGSCVKLSVAVLRIETFVFADLPDRR